MNPKTVFRSAFIALCLVGMLVLPAAAAQNGQTSSMKESPVEQGLRDDLWSNHQQYRLQRFDLNVEQATGIMTILDKYGINTTSCRDTLTSISGQRSGLEAALSSHDSTMLKAVNAEQKNLWTQFKKDIRDAFRGHYGSRTADSILSPVTGTVDSEDRVL